MDGVINLYKPTGITSFDAVYKIKKLCNTKKVGHTGTLDPEASGVLPICIGSATKIVDYIMNDNKVYRAILKLGIETDTYDREGIVINKSDVMPNEQDIVNAIQSFIGEINQVPPMYSAIKVNGKKLYELARKGIEIERKPRKITIYDINIDEIKFPYVSFKVKCSKGTYIRSLCHDIGLKLGSFGTMWGLERLSSGNFKCENSVKLEDLTSQNVYDYLISVEEALSFYDKIIIPEKYSKMILNGVTIRDENLIKNYQNHKNHRIYIENNFIGIGIINEFGLKMVKLLNILKV